MNAIDCLFIHPSLECKTKGMYYTIIPIGLLAMADLLEKNGFESRVLSISVEKEINPKFSISKYIKKFNVKVAAIDLHWYFHSHNVIELAKEIKEKTGAIIVLGGFTASFFNNEIINSFPFIDAIIRGDGETPLLEFMKQLRKSGSLKNMKIPNLTWRYKKKIKHNPISYVADKNNLSQLDYSNIGLLSHWQHYVGTAMKSLVLSFTDNKKPIKNIWYTSIGRGCNINCSYCGGSKSSHYKMSGRSSPCFRCFESVLNEIKLLYDKGITTFCFEFDPPTMSEKYYIKLFSGIRDESMDISTNFGSWSLPSNKFLDSFSKTFDLTRSCIAISPESGSEKVRRINKGIYYTNNFLFKTLQKMGSRHIYNSLYFAVGLPGENMSDFRMTLNLFSLISSRFDTVMKVNAVPLEPCSPMSVNPRKYEIEIYRKSFADYYSYVKEIANSELNKHPMGYMTKHFTEPEIMKLKTQAFKKFYLNHRFILDQIFKIRNLKGLRDGVNIFFDTLFDSAQNRELFNQGEKNEI